ncbi:NAD-dependent epimerase/dehydratase family protein [Cellulophaga sp. Hel_I_12]|uniref:NAD-dependent epimerase/dehydratase family protein n=1 Tax=Cellulophaga sp. Hel_I_12 TaxID=1249972 RepID=UPI0006477ECB|nr:NAD-dependent epimerase/dehydratase family protein [Cellulophaga sp. Hel_I_12]
MILVTGGTGLVGAHLLFELTKNGSAVKAICRATSDVQKVEKVFSYYTENYKELYQKIQWINADLTNIPDLETAFAGVTYVYHCAALISFDPKDYDQLQKVNCEGTSNIVNLCIAKNIKKLCYVSSIATIGKNLNHEAVDEETEWTKKDANVYALSKYDAEMEVWRGSQEGLAVVILNPGVIIGPGFWGTGSGKLYTTVAKEHRYYPPSGTGFVAVNDVVQLLVMAMNSNIDKERFITISENLSYKDVLGLIALELGLKPPTKALAFWQLEVLWRLDALRSFLFKGERKISQKMVASLRENKVYRNEKVTSTFNYKFQALQPSIAFTSEKFKKEKL